MSSCSRRAFLSKRHVLHTCLLVQQQDMSSCSTRRRAFLLSKKTCPLVQQEDMPSLLLNRKTCLLVKQEDMSVFLSNRRDVFLFNKKIWGIQDLIHDWRRRINPTMWPKYGWRCANSSDNVRMKYETSRRCRVICYSLSRFLSSPQLQCWSLVTTPIRKLLTAWPLDRLAAW